MRIALRSGSFPQETRTAAAQCSVFAVYQTLKLNGSLLLPWKKAGSIGKSGLWSSSLHRSSDIVSLFSLDTNDRSFNAPSGWIARNWGGFVGAFLADLLLQGLGLPPTYCRHFPGTRRLISLFHPSFKASRSQRQSATASSSSVSQFF